MDIGHTVFILIGPLEFIRMSYSSKFGGFQATAKKTQKNNKTHDINHFRSLE